MLSKYPNEKIRTKKITNGLKTRDEDLVKGLARNLNNDTGHHRAYSKAEKRIHQLEGKNKAMKEMLLKIAKDTRNESLKKEIMDSINVYIPEKRNRRKTSIYRGVSYLEQLNKWRSRLVIDGKEHTTYHSSELTASLAYDNKIMELCPENKNLRNFIPNSNVLPKRFNVKKFRKVIVRLMNKEEIKNINRKGASYFNRKECGIAYEYLNSIGAEIDLSIIDKSYVE